MRVVTIRAAPRSPRLPPYGACSGSRGAPHPRTLVLVKLPCFPIPPPLERRIFGRPTHVRGRLLQRPRVEEGREAPPIGARGCISEVMSRLRSFLLSGVLNNRLHRRTPRYTPTRVQAPGRMHRRGRPTDVLLWEPRGRGFGSCVHALYSRGNMQSSRTTQKPRPRGSRTLTCS
jgi:hypothetical protein